MFLIFLKIFNIFYRSLFFFFWSTGKRFAEISLNSSRSLSVYNFCGFFFIKFWNLFISEFKWSQFWNSKLIIVENYANDQKTFKTHGKKIMGTIQILHSNGGFWMKNYEITGSNKNLRILLKLCVIPDHVGYLMKIELNTCEDYFSHSKTDSNHITNYCNYWKYTEKKLW